jgi:hypothetical protein
VVEVAVPQHLHLVPQAELEHLTTNKNRGAELTRTTRSREAILHVTSTVSTDERFVIVQERPPVGECDDLGMCADLLSYPPPL